MKASYYQTKVVITQEEAKKLGRCTQKQARSEQWICERRTASRVGGVAKMRKTTKRSKKVQDLLYSTFRDNEATRCGVEMEDTTIQEYTAYQQGGHPGLTTDKCGLFGCLENPWLAARQYMTLTMRPNLWG